MHTNKPPQANNMVDWVHQVIYTIIVTKDIDSKVYDYIYPCSEGLSSISWEIIDSYKHMLDFAPG